VGFISGPAEAKPSREGLRAYRDVMSAAGLPCDEQYVTQGNWLSSSGYVGMEELLRKDVGVTAVCASNDAMALGAMRAVYDYGLRVPNDIAIVGFDNIPVLAPYSHPSLSTVNNPLYLVGRTSAELLYGSSRRDLPKQYSDTSRSGDTRVVRVREHEPARRLPGDGPGQPGAGAA